MALEEPRKIPGDGGEFVPAMSRMCGETEVAFMGIHGHSSYCTRLTVFNFPLVLGLKLIKNTITRQIER